MEIHFTVSTKQLVESRSPGQDLKIKNQTRIRLLQQPNCSFSVSKRGMIKLQRS